MSGVKFMFFFIMRILVEMVADIAMPMPVQVGYHLWQMITLKNL